jgi:hypothetical protein
MRVKPRAAIGFAESPLSVARREHGLSLSAKLLNVPVRVGRQLKFQSKSNCFGCPGTGITRRVHEIAGLSAGTLGYPGFYWTQMDLRTISVGAPGMIAIELAARQELTYLIPKTT